MRSPLARPGCLAVAAVVFGLAATALVVLAVRYGSTGGGLVLLMTGTGVLVCTINGALALASIPVVRDQRAERQAADLAAANEREDRIGR